MPLSEPLSGARNGLQGQRPGPGAGQPPNCRTASRGSEGEAESAKGAGEPQPSQGSGREHPGDITQVGKAGEQRKFCPEAWIPPPTTWIDKEFTSLSLHRHLGPILASAATQHLYSNE